ncbi:energy transducer TonB [Sphingobium sp. Leaf26]|uniref:energy transducer TonB n=1 Tax=Sphingobium sp. Leaf26 TaxID=1735693 RepID=UPI001F2AD993|nr:energy transducer TonB [Sphingobium sp. Leaf26]
MMRLMNMPAMGHAPGKAETPATGENGQSRYGAGRKSPLGMGGTVAVHALVIGAFLLIPKEIIDVITPSTPITTRNIPVEPPPPLDPVEDVKTDAKLPSQPQPDRPTAPDPFVPLPTGDTGLIGSDHIGDIGPVPPPYIPPPLPNPVLTEASIDPRAKGAFQPDYPGTMIRQGVEGAVTVRVTISPDGRVTAIEKVSASDESFWLATERHALRKWRFRPATRDGVAITSTKTLTVRFTLTN